eukprot:761023-Hanusia_phi.AAC.3
MLLALPSLPGLKLQRGCPASFSSLPSLLSLSPPLLSSPLISTLSPVQLQQLLEEELTIQISPAAAQLILEICSEVPISVSTSSSFSSSSSSSSSFLLVPRESVVVSWLPSSSTWDSLGKKSVKSFSSSPSSSPPLLPLSSPFSLPGFPPVSRRRHQTSTLLHLLPLLLLPHLLLAPSPLPHSLSVVGIDGSIFKLYTRFKERISLTLQVRPELFFLLTSSLRQELLGEDGNKVLLEVRSFLGNQFSSPAAQRGRLGRGCGCDRGDSWTMTRRGCGRGRGGAEAEIALDEGGGGGA